jgi:hypothetical protein
MSSSKVRFASVSVNESSAWLSREHPVLYVALVPGPRRIFWVSHLPKYQVPKEQEQGIKQQTSLLFPSIETKRIDSSVCHTQFDLQTNETGTSQNSAWFPPPRTTRRRRSSSFCERTNTGTSRRDRCTVPCPNESCFHDKTRRRCWLPNKNWSNHPGPTLRRCSTVPASWRRSHLVVAQR